MHSSTTRVDAHTSDFYGKSTEPACATGTLEHGPQSLLPSETSGVPVKSGADSESGTLEHQSRVEMFVSTCLRTWTTDRPHIFARDVQINDTAYRRLDPEYFAWLRSRMTMAKLAANAGQISREEFDGLREKFNTLQDWAIRRFSEPALLGAVRDLDTRTYEPPVAEPDSPPQPSRPAEAVKDTVLAKVDAIRERAVSLGWTTDQLYATGPSGRFGVSHDRGLVCYLKPQDEIGEVTRQSIEIILPNGVRQRFYNMLVEQPWITRLR